MRMYIIRIKEAEETKDPSDFEGKGAIYLTFNDEVANGKQQKGSPLEIKRSEINDTGETNSIDWDNLNLKKKKEKSRGRRGE